MDGMIDSLMGIFELSCSSDLCPENLHPALEVKGELWPELGVGPGREAGVPDGGWGSSPRVIELLSKGFCKAVSSFSTSALPTHPAKNQK